MSKDKIQEAKECMDKAAKYLKLSLLKWVPDYDSAADEYMKAATCFRVGKSYKESKECLMKASENYLQNGSLFHAAKCMDQAIIMAKEIGDTSDVFKLAMKASHYYQQHGSSGSASLLLNKAADILQPSDPDSAVKLLKEASNISGTEDSIGQAMEYTHKVARLLVKLNRYEEAENELKRQFDLVTEGGPTSNMGRVAVELFLLQLAKDDYVAAKKVLQEYGMQYCEQAEIYMLDSIINAYSDHDCAQIKKMLNSPFIKHMDVEFAVLAKNLADKWIVEPKEQVTNIENEETEAASTDFGGKLC
ncbi:gamma-soluble NSF attachment protein [Aphis craccivora]|uniref:Gamma-soluble NSF attachment protein n=1 Tax=Aphis craccivora TaxID=307492 RepID=A0A6G0Z4H1_APHCR|nr:gamma-soluble NSF attachment protein [Aphis craccivora]